MVVIHKFDKEILRLDIDISSRTYTGFNCIAYIYPFCIRFINSKYISIR